MARTPRKPCRAFGCPARAVAGGYCEQHQNQRPKRWRANKRPSAAARGYGYQWRKIRDDFLERHPICVVCGDVATDVDHIIPRRQGGTDDDSNLQSLCHSCHSRKTALYDGAFSPKGGDGKV
ncbi:MAG: HNH endonuclease [Chloroflexi bacterium]|nr:MAG: HNH endonuclease [Chloroflexota bacterium]